MQRWSSNERRGFSLVYTMIVVAVLFGIISFAVDLGRVQLAKTELQRAADASARYAAMRLDAGINEAIAAAIDAADDNQVDGSPLALVPDEDVELGTWDAATETFTPLSGSARDDANAVRVTARRVASRGEGVPLLFARVVGTQSCDVAASAVVLRMPLPSAFIALESIDVKNNLYAASYNSAIDPTPSTDTRLANGMLGSNGSITAKNNEVVGAVVLGPDGTHNLDLARAPIILADPIAVAPVDFSGAPAANPGGIAKNFNVHGYRSLPGGDYYFTSIRLNNNATLTFSGPATLYVDGDVDFANSGSILAYESIPANLKIRQRGDSTAFGGPAANNVTVVADVEAPQSHFSAKNNGELYGRGVFRSMEFMNNAVLYYDESLKTELPGVTQGSTFATVQ